MAIQIEDVHDALPYGLAAEHLFDAGAYGATMSSNYNTRPLAPEVMLDAGTLSVIRKRQPIEQLLDLEADGGPLAY